MHLDITWLRLYNQCFFCRIASITFCYIHISKLPLFSGKFSSEVFSDGDISRFITLQIPDIWLYGEILY